MKRLVCLLQSSASYRRTAFVAGARMLGYKEVKLSDYPLHTEGQTFTPDKEDLLITWNRYGNHALYQAFEGASAPILIVENGYLGKQWLGDTWFSVALNQHNGAGVWPDEGPSRWNSFGYELQPYRDGGEELIVLPQRGIGWPGVAMPQGWVEGLKIPCPHRVRAHPGADKDVLSLGEDLANARAVVTWGSGAALKALAMGIPVVYDMPKWIGKDAATPLSSLTTAEHWSKIAPVPREKMFERLAWAMWRLSEVESGAAIEQVLSAM